MSTTKRVLTAIVAVLLGLLLSTTSASGAPGKPGPGPGGTASSSSAPEHGVTARALPAGASNALTAIQKRIAAYVAGNGTAYTFGSYVNPATGRIVLETNAPASVVSTLVGSSGLAAAEARAAGQVQLRRVATSDAFHRRDDVPSYWGGGGISNGSSICSSGYAVRNSAATVSMVTAGHCYANGTSVSTESQARFYGTVSGRHLASLTFDAKDMELMGGSSYAGRVFTGGTTSTSSIPVVAAGSATVGYADYCHSGRTTGENCGHTATSVTAQVCTTTGCKSPVIAFTGGNLSQGGDSGSPFYAKNSSGAWIRGHVIAGNGSTSYAETWNKVASTYGVSIVTG
ncbi:MAG: hypothetical protein JWQ45_2615 [Blastococcus sp.]|jgi:hypothetical protein|nr:hypothetical protein [Blastococcus sp.]